jgi:Arc/MetJ-type ribon-helix-helix transcriptional regulator
MKKSISVTIDEDLLKWLESQVKTKRFSSISHGLDFCVNEQKKRETRV